MKMKCYNSPADSYMIDTAKLSCEKCGSTDFHIEKADETNIEFKNGKETCRTFFPCPTRIICDKCDNFISDSLPERSSK